jgi:hypothetical protein
VAQIIEKNGLMPTVGEQSRHCTTYIPGASGDQDLHKKDCPFANTFDNLESITVVRARAGMNAFKPGSQTLPHVGHAGDEQLPGANELHSCPMRTFSVRDGSISPRTKQVRAFCQMPWVRDEKNFIPTAGRTEWTHPATDSASRFSSRLSGTTFSRAYSDRQEDQHKSAARMPEAFRSEMAGMHGQRTDANGFQLLHQMDDDGKNGEACQIRPAASPDDSVRSTF